MSEKRRNKGGRNPKLDPAVFRYTVRFNEEEHNRFLSMFEKSGFCSSSSMSSSTCFVLLIDM